MQLALIGFDNRDIIVLETELAAPDVFAQTGRLNGIKLGVLLGVLQRETFSASAHLCNFSDNEVAFHCKNKGV